jgi:hypothetical protein
MSKLNGRVTGWRTSLVERHFLFVGCTGEEWMVSILRGEFVSFDESLDLSKLQESYSASIERFEDQNNLSY